MLAQPALSFFLSSPLTSPSPLMSEPACNPRMRSECHTRSSKSFFEMRCARKCRTKVRIVGIRSAAQVDQMECGMSRDTKKQAMYAKAMPHMLGVTTDLTSCECCSQSAAEQIDQLSRGPTHGKAHLEEGNLCSRRSLLVFSGLVLHRHF